MKKSDKYNKYELIDSLDTEGGGVKNIIQIKDNQIAFYQSLDKILVIFNLSKKFKLLSMSIVITDMKNISNNILALVNLGCIKLFDINSRVITNFIDIFKDENSLHTIKCIYPSYDKLLVYHYDKDNKKHHFAKYKIEENNLIFEQENSRFKMESSIIDMGIMKKGHLVTLSFDGVIRFFSQE